MYLFKKLYLFKKFFILQILLHTLHTTLKKPPLPFFRLKESVQKKMVTHTHTHTLAQCCVASSDLTSNLTSDPIYDPINILFSHAYDKLEYFGSAFTNFDDADLDVQLAAPTVMYPLLAMDNFVRDVTTALMPLEMQHYTPQFELQSKTHGWTKALLMQPGDYLIVEHDGVHSGVVFVFGPGGVILPYSKKAAHGTAYVFESSRDHTFTSLILSQATGRFMGKFAVYYQERCTCLFCVWN